MENLFSGRGTSLAGINRIVQFFSLAVSTQFVLMLSQLVVLPIQIHKWGTGTTAGWYAAIAIANITSVADCGLRLAGHSELVRSLRRDFPDDLAAAEHFRQVWGWIRALVLAVTAALILGGIIISGLHHNASYPLWKALLVLACALETVLIVRIIYLDSLGFYRGAESTYFIFATLRFLFTVGGLAMFNLEVNGLAWLFFASSVAATVWQSRICARAQAVGLFEPFPRRLSLPVLALARHTLAEPCGNWVRLSMPVLVITALAGPGTVTAYVALRAAFGAARSTIQQLARVASVEYIRVETAGRTEAATILSAFVLVAVVFGTAFAAGIVVDNLRILGLWLRHFDRVTFQWIAASFAASAPFYCYQIQLATLFRVGRLDKIAARLYAFVLYSAGFALIAWTFHSLTTYLVLLAVAEISLSTTFMKLSLNADERKYGSGPGFAAACTGSLLVLMLSAVISHSSATIFTATTLSAISWSSLCLLLALGVPVGSALLWNADRLKGFMKGRQLQPPVVFDQTLLIPIETDQQAAATHCR